jgi:NAD(P)-dependent dehydrogenase (short-subunit alcohol dehydrogenase family)
LAESSTTVALVTGGSRGIGRAAAVALARAGHRVAINYRARHEDAREAAAEAGGAALLPGDVGEPGVVEGLVHGVVERFGRLDVFVSCAVAPVARGVLELTPEDWETSLRVNARAFVFGAQAAAEAMPGTGRIVAVSATGGHRIRNPLYAPLGIAKGAVEAAVRFLAVALAPRGITVNAVAPGPTPTEAFGRMAAGEAEALSERLLARTPLGRRGEPADAARLVAFLCSDEAGWITGRCIVSDGGYSLT